MIKALMFLLLLFFSLEARENPFFPSVGEQDLVQTSNKKDSIKPLKRATIKLPSDARVLKKVSLTYKSLDGSIQTKSIDLNKAIDWHLPIFISQNIGILTKEKKDKNYKLLFKSKYIKIYELFNELKIVTKDKMIRNFLLTSPHRIVVDFERDVSLKSISKKNKNSIFKKINLGTHKNYYRVVIELDGKYRYTMKKLSNGYIFELR